MRKKCYATPHTEQILVVGNTLMDGLSMGVSDQNAVGGGDAKGAAIFEEEYAPSSPNLWE